MPKSINILLPILIAMASPVAASDDKTDRATLRGVKSVCVIVETTGPNEEWNSVTKGRLQGEVAGRLAAAGIVADKDSTTCLYLNLRALAAIGKGNKPIGLYALDVSLQFLQTVALSRDPALKTYAPTWSVSNLATVPADELVHTSGQIAVDLSDRFVDAYRSVNPK